MTAADLALAYVAKAQARLKALAVLHQEGDYSDVVREAQEIVELATKAILLAAGIDPPKWHDVGGLLVEFRARLPESVRPHAERLAAVSRRLRKERELAFYGDVDFIPTEAYTEEEARKAMDEAAWVVEVARAGVDAAGAHGQTAARETADGGQGCAGEGGGFVPYEEVPHTADWALRARGRTLEELFVNAARGMYWLIAEEMPAAAPVARTVEVEAASAEGLLVAWLNELIYLTEREGLVLTGFRVRELAVPGRESATARLRAEVAGDRTRAGLTKYIKAATYHNLAIERGDGLYEAVVVFDV